MQDKEENIVDKAIKEVKNDLPASSGFLIERK